MDGYQATHKKEEVEGGDTPVGSLKLMDGIPIHYYPLINFPPFLDPIVLYLCISLYTFSRLSKKIQKYFPTEVVISQNTLIACLTIR